MVLHTELGITNHPSGKYVILLGEWADCRAVAAVETSTDIESAESLEIGQKPSVYARCHYLKLLPSFLEPDGI